MRVLVACEYSGRVRDAFAKRGHDAWSCDLLPTEAPGNHYQGDVFEVVNRGWDLLIAHPPCTDLAVSGARHFAAKKADGRQDAALDFVRKLLSLKIPKIALENPVSIISSHIRKPDQIIQPWQFGHTEQKATCLWLKGLPLLKPTNNVYDLMMTLPAREREYTGCRLGRIGGKSDREPFKVLQTAWRLNGDK
jgi:site-specific DNA-cytosine methylase